MSSRILRLGLIAMIVTGGWAMGAGRVAAEPAEPEWSCQGGVGDIGCCECSRTPSLRVCREATTAGQHSDKCGLTDDTPCTGNCMVVH